MNVLRQLDRHPRAAIALSACVGALLPALYGWIEGTQVSHVHDESSYLMAADTFARGRLTNPSPNHPEFFESQHVLVVPTYMSKYPPGQGLALAAGQALFGHPVVGVWLSCGCLAACVCWMLQAWTTRRWAWLTTLAFVISGTSSYWAQGYMGGAVAGCGGALLFGSLRRTLREARVATAILMGLGVIVLAISRPYEGALACVPVGLVLGGWLLRDSRRTLGEKSTRFVLPLVAVLLGGGGLLAGYNHAVTGDWRRLPYTVNHAQYFRSGPFIFSARQVPLREPNPRVLVYYAGQHDTPKSGLRLLAAIARNSAERVLKMFSSTLLERWSVGRNWHAGFPLFLLAVIIALCRKDRWFWFCIGVIVWQGIGASIVKWWMMHYSAPVVPLVLALFANAGRRTSACLGRRAAFVAPLSLLALAVCGFALNTRSEPGGRAIPQRAYAPGADEAGPQPPLLTAGYEIQRQLRNRSGKHLVFVRYSEDYPSSDECVYNGGDLIGAPIVFAHSLGDMKDRELVGDLPGRSVWLADVSERLVDVRPYDPVASSRHEP